MNTKQKTFLVLGIVAFCLSALFVPPESDESSLQTYNWFFSYQKYYPVFSKVVLLTGVDMEVLWLEWITIGALMVLGIYVAGRK